MKDLAAWKSEAKFPVNWGQGFSLKPSDLDLAAFLKIKMSQLVIVGVQRETINQVKSF